MKKKGMKGLAIMFIVMLLASAFAQQMIAIRAMSIKYEGLMLEEKIHEEFFAKFDVPDGMRACIQKHSKAYEARVNSANRIEHAMNTMEDFNEAFENTGDVLELVCELLSAIKGGNDKTNDYVAAYIVKVFYCDVENSIESEEINLKAYNEYVNQMEKRLGGAPPGLFFV